MCPLMLIATMSGQYSGELTFSKSVFFKGFENISKQKSLGCTLSDMTEAQFYYKTESFDNNF